ncbi:hypothetical protein [Nocardioides stalactiti]|uniref:hypothetical protein n=1 Tax=Nocardioides stalactiti TaxID=2755356 RepID=UPI001600AB83|nr:hypothetical protein [Nocardioides stalactiti]
MRLWTTLPCVLLVASVGACGEDSTTAATDAPSSNDAPTTQAKRGDAAVWSIRRGTELTSGTTTFTASVSRLGCHSGVTGRVLEPAVTYEDAQVVVTFEVEAAVGGSFDCQGNDQVAHEVVLDEPLGDRALVDGSCLEGGEAGTTSFCSPDGVRWPR